MSSLTTTPAMRPDCTSLQRAFASVLLAAILHAVGEGLQLQTSGVQTLSGPGSLEVQRNVP